MKGDVSWWEPAKRCSLKNIAKRNDIRRSRLASYEQMFIALLIATLISSAASTEPTSLDKAPPRYRLDVSEDDALCRPILNFYNKHLSDRDNEQAGYIEDRFQIDTPDKGPKFLIRPVQSWELEKFPSINIFNDNERKEVILIDKGINYQFMTYGTDLIIMKNGSSFKDDLRPTSVEIESWISFPKGLLNQSSEPDYPLRKYPDFEERKTNWDAMNWAERAKHLSSAPQRMGSSNTRQRIIKYKNMIFVTARDGLDGPLSGNLGARILIYKILPTGGLEDMCYYQLR